MTILQFKGVSVLSAPRRSSRSSGVSGVVSPHGKVTKKLLSVSTFTRPIRKGHLVASQFPATIPDAGGRTIRKPKGW